MGCRNGVRRTQGRPEDTRRRGKAEREAGDGPTNQMHRQPQANTSSSLGAHLPLPGFDPQVNLAMAGRAPGPPLVVHRRAGRPWPCWGVVAPWIQSLALPSAASSSCRPLWELLAGWCPTPGVGGGQQLCEQAPREPQHGLVSHEHHHVDGEGTAAVEQQPLEEHARPLFPNAGQHTVQEATVALAAPAVRLQARLDHVHGGGHGPGQRPGTATGHQHARDICGESARAPRLEAAPGRLGRVGQAPEAGPPGREGALGSCHPCDLSTATWSRPVLTRVGGHEHPTWGPRGQRGLDPSPLQAAMPAGLTTPLHTLTCTIPGPRPPCSPGRLWPAGVSHSQRVAYERK